MVTTLIFINIVFALTQSQ